MCLYIEVSLLYIQNLVMKMVFIDMRLATQLMYIFNQTSMTLIIVFLGETYFEVKNIFPILKVVT